MKKINLPPYAPALIDSIRAIGYTFESALADIIDNSIAADAKTVTIRFSPYGDPYVAILDDGDGMEADELTRAMRHGSCNPGDPRSEDDLGRFGLGLKTASLSQCRRLTVISRKDGITHTRCWDLDMVAHDEDWTLLELEPEEIKSLPFVEELNYQNKGTLVLWQQLDRLASGERNMEEAMGEKMAVAHDHLALIFHRYLEKEVGQKRINLIINGRSVEPVDPFLSEHAATERLPEEDIRIDGQRIRIKPFILPHLSKLSREQLALAGGEEGLRRQQGFYIYRNRRLIIWGTWFRLIRKDELTKLARVRVDIPNTLDHLWALDVKKATAFPPERVRANLRRVVERIASGSKRVYRFRGRKTADGTLVHVWDRVKGRDGIFYKINRGHPMAAAMIAGKNENELRFFDMFLKTLEMTFPVDSLYADMAAEQRVDTEENGVDDTLRELAEKLIAIAETVDGGRERLLEEMHMMDPFCLYPEITQLIVREYCDNKRE